MSNRQRQTVQGAIAAMMAEEFTEMGTPQAVSAPPSLPTTSMAMSGFGSLTGDECPDGECDEGFTEEELKIAKRFVELMGDIDRAREIVDRVGECEECLDLVDEPSDEEAIEMMSDMVPHSPDFPTGRAIEITSLYNPGAHRSGPVGM